MVSFYALHIFAGILIGTVFVTIISKLLQHPKGTLFNAILLNVVWNFLVWTTITYLPDVAFAFIAILIAEYVLIKTVFGGSPTGALIFLFIGNVLPTALALIFGETVIQFLAGIL